MISLKFRREKRIWQSFLLTNYCSFPRRISVTGGKHQASKRSDLPLLPPSCLLRRGGRGETAPPSIPSSRSFHPIFCWKTGSFPSLSAAICISAIKRPAWGSDIDRRTSFQSAVLRGSLAWVANAKRKALPEPWGFATDPAWDAGPEHLGTWCSLARTGPVLSFSSYFSTLDCRRL